MLRGITVTLWERTENGVDAFNRPRYDETAVQVKNVLVTPAGETGSELLDATDEGGQARMGNRVPGGLLRRALPHRREADEGH